MPTFIFGHGSLINMKHTYEIYDSYSRAFAPVCVNNIKRSFNVCGDGVTYLGITRTPNYKCNGIVFEVDEKELAKLDMRERFYMRKQIDIDDIDFIRNISISLLKGEDIVYAYFPKYNETHFPSEIFQINIDYIDICVRGCIDIDGEFLDEFVSQTHDWSNHMI